MGLNVNIFQFQFSKPYLMLQFLKIHLYLTLALISRILNVLNYYF